MLLRTQPVARALIASKFELAVFRCCILAGIQVQYYDMLETNREPNGHTFSVVHLSRPSPIALLFNACSLACICYDTAVHHWLGWINAWLVAVLLLLRRKKVWLSQLHERSSSPDFCLCVSSTMLALLWCFFLYRLCCTACTTAAGRVSLCVHLLLVSGRNDNQCKRERG